MPEEMKRQYEVFLRTVTRTQEFETLQEKLDTLAAGIVEAQTWRRALISLFDENWNVTRIGSANVDPEDLKRIRRRPPLSPEERKKLFDERYRLGHSFFIPHDDVDSREILKKGLASRRDRSEFVDWHPNDVLFVPLHGSGHRIIGTLSVDDPNDGRRPTAESLRIIELFAREAATCIETSLLIDELKKTRTYLQTLIEDSPDAIITTDNMGNVVVFNGGASRLLGYGPDEIIGKPVLNLYASKEDAKQVMFALRARRSGGESGKISNHETTVRAKSGEEIPVSLSASILRDPEGRVIGTAGISKDLRPMRKLETELIKAEKIATLGEVGAMLSHEVNNFLESILSACELSHRFLGDSEVKCVLDEKGLKREVEKEKYRLRVIQEEALRIGQITEKLQLMAKGKEYKTKKYLDGVAMIDVDKSLEKLTEAKEIRVLVADDQLHVRKFLKEILEDDGFTVDQVEDGEEAIEAARNGNYDLLISDIRMPGKNGNEVVAALKEIAPDLPVILITAYGYDPSHIAVRAKREGVVDVLYKPFDLRKLKEAMSRALSGRTAG
ncbi:MAG: response regulator [Candidatus Eisenbacteria bacterium]|nr:response regulator [Candidatus Eisenbacteria bacterium]